MSKPVRVRIHARVHDEDGATNDLELLGEATTVDGRLKLSPEQGKRARLQRFIKGFRQHGLGLEQNDEEFLDHLPDRVGFYAGKVERL